RIALGLRGTLVVLGPGGSAVAAAKPRHSAPVGPERIIVSKNPASQRFARPARGRYFGPIIPERTLLISAGPLGHRLPPVLNRECPHLRRYEARTRSSVFHSLNKRCAGLCDHVRTLNSVTT